MEKLQAKKKTRQTIQSSKDSKDKQIESEMDGTNIGEHITYDVLRMILEYSNIKDLTRAAMVCRSWNEAAKKEIQTRIRPQHMVCEFNSLQTRQEVSKTFTDQLVIKPSIGLLFVGKEIQDTTYKPLVPIDCLCHRVLRETNCITVWNYAIVHDDSESEGNIVSGLFLPNIPGVKIKCFTIDRLELAQIRTTTHQRSREKLARKFFKISPKEENIKSLILFANQEAEDLDESSQRDDVKQILKAFLSQQQTNNKEKISIWGGITNKLTVCTSILNGDTCHHTASLAGISICGAGVSTWSKVLDSRVKTKAQVEKELTAFRDAVKLQKYSAGFMFACLGRGEDWYAEKNVEPKIFRKLFPNVPLVGSFGGGEFGLTTVPQECSKGAGTIHQYSTIFLILSYGSMRKMK